MQVSRTGRSCASLCCQRQQIRRYIVGITVFAALFTLPRYFEYDVVQSGALTTDLQNDTTASATTRTDNVLLTSWSVAQTNFSKNRIYRIVYFNLRPIKLAAYIEADSVSIVAHSKHWSSLAFAISTWLTPRKSRSVAFHDFIELLSAKMMFVLKTSYEARRCQSQICYFNLD